MTEGTSAPPEARSYRDGKRRIRSIRWMLFLIVAVQLAVTAIFSVISSFLAAPLPLWLRLLVTELLAYFLPLSLYTRANQLLTLREARERFGLRPFRPSLLPLIILAGVGCQFLMIVLDLPVSLLLGQSDEYLPQNLWELAAELVMIGVIPSLFEEFLLRGIVYGVMAEFNTRAALVFTTVMFALMHGSAAGFLGYLLLGLTLILVLRRTGSLYACMILHLSNNVTALLLSYFSPELLYAPGVTIWLFVLGILAYGAALLILLRRTPRPKAAARLRTGEFLGQSFVNLPILLCIAGIVLQMLR